MERIGQDREDTQAKAQLIVDAKLLDIGLPAPNPGIIYTVSLMHYEVMEIIRGDYPHSSIFVGHDLPNLTESDFSVGTCHRLWLTKEFPQYASILDKFQTAVSGTKPFFCLFFDVLEHLNGNRKKI